MRTILKYSLTAFLLLLSCAVALAQTDRKEVRAGNRQFKKGNWQNAEIEYRKAQVKDSSSFAANYNLAGALYREGNFDEAGKSLGRLKDAAPVSANSADYYYNLGNIAVQKKDWKAAVDAYKQSLLRNPGDLDAKENYAYAKQMLKNEGGDGGDDQQNQDQNNNQNQDNQNNNNGQNQDNDQNKDQNQDQNQNNDQNHDQNQGDQPKPQQGEGQGDAKISPQQAQQMLKAVQAREKETQDKVNKEKAALLKARQKEKNWYSDEYEEIVLHCSFFAHSHFSDVSPECDQGRGSGCCRCERAVQCHFHN